VAFLAATSPIIDNPIGGPEKSRPAPPSPNTIARVHFAFGLEGAHQVLGLVLEAKASDRGKSRLRRGGV
jgi:hypothetical protein